VSDEEFLAHESVCVSISELAGGFHGGLDDEYRESLMELLFNVAATTKVRRVLLNLWFILDGRIRDGQSGSEVSTDVYSLPSFGLGLTLERFPDLLCIVGERSY
jgi:hypothetical protein